MSDPMHFFCAFEPPTATKQEKKVRMVKNAKGALVPRFYPSDAWAAAEDAIRAQLEPHRPKAPVSSGVVLDVVWCFPSNGCVDGAPWIDKPDTDNLNKGLKDIMTDLGWWLDDSQVFSEHITKIHSRIPGIRIDIEVL